MQLHCSKIGQHKLLGGPGSQSQPSSLTDVDTEKEKAVGRRVMVADWPEFTGLLTSSFLLSPDLVSGHKIFAIPKESFIMYSRKAHRALTTVPWLPGPLASHWAGKRPESLITVFSCVAIRCFSQLLMKGLSKFSMYLKDQCGKMSSPASLLATAQPLTLEAHSKPHQLTLVPSYLQVLSLVHSIWLIYILLHILFILYFQYNAIHKELHLTFVSYHPEAFTF